MTEEFVRDVKSLITFVEESSGLDADLKREVADGLRAVANRAAQLPSERLRAECLPPLQDAANLLIRKDNPPEKNWVVFDMIGHVDDKYFDPEYGSL